MSPAHPAPQSIWTIEEFDEDRQQDREPLFFPNLPRNNPTENVLPDLDIMEDEMLANLQDISVQVLDRMDPTRIAHPHVHYLYTASPTSNSDDLTRWTEYADPVVEQEELRERTARFNIIHRKEAACENSGGSVWKSHSVIIRGPPKTIVMAAVFGDYPAMDLSANEIVLRAPFQPLVQRWDALQTYRDTTDNINGRYHAELLINVMKEAVAPHVTFLARLRDTGNVTFESLEFVFCPGEVVIQETDGIISAYKLASFTLVDSKNDTPVYYLAKMDFVDWNGSRFGLSRKSVVISEFPGELPVTTLDIYPINWAKNSKYITKDLIKRGRKFENLRGYHFKHASGVKVVTDSNAWPPKSIQRPVSGRVVVDAHAYYHCQKLVKPRLRDLQKTVSVSDTATTGVPATGEQHPVDWGTLWGNINDDQGAGWGNTSNDPGAGWGNANDGHEGDWSLPIRPPGNQEAYTHNLHREEQVVRLSDEQCIITNAHVRGMDMENKDWCELYVSDLADIKWNPEIFSKLVLQEGVKETALGIAKHKQTANVDVDFVAGKGRGLVLLMFGPPGAGKTLTAEAVAEECHVPLYSMSAGDLGTASAHLEKGLDLAFDSCALWNAILLLDEADVFLAARTTGSLERNELVSVFLRRLEHYQGTLFLTTNRIQTIDPAFQSRIDLILPFDPLTQSARKDVWKNFMARTGGAGKFDIDDAELEELAAMDLNGREIKNLVKTALILNVESTGKVDSSRLLKLANMRLRAQKILEN